MRVFKVIISIWSIAILFSHNISAATCDSVSLKLMEQTWREFRAIHPFGFQTVGLKHYGDTCVFVMSEPAEWVEAEELESLFSKYHGHLIIGRKSFGYDGGLYDAIGCAKLGPISFNCLEKSLFELLYGTAYKPYYTDLDNPCNHIYYSDYKLDFFVPDISWHHWEKNEKFIVPSPIDKSIEFLSLSKANISNELYYSRERGFVLWIINPKEINSMDILFRSNARKFTLDTDLIVHSFLKDNNLYVIGREREIPVTVLPPLRSETICSIIRNGGNKNTVLINPDSMMIVKDSVSNDTVPLCWATPILMNSSLWNTELGNLMLLTDLMLKSWSENAEIIDLFVDYPLPSSFFTQNGVANEINYKPQYLWSDFNAGNIGYLIPYFPRYKTNGDSLSAITITTEHLEISQKAHDYFSKLYNTDLARINQYTFFSQVFLLHPYSPSKTTLTFQRNWVQSPTMTISNNPWGYGGYICPIPQTARGIAKALTARGFRLPPNFPTRLRIPYVNSAVQQELRAWTRFQQAEKNLAANRYSPVAKREYNNAKIAYDKAKASLTSVLSSFDTPSPSVPPALTPRLPPGVQSVRDIGERRRNDPRNILISPSLGYTERGFVPKIHNATSKNLLLSDPEKQELLDKSYKEKKMMDNLRLQLRQFNIPVKVILNEQRIIIHAINILNNYDKGYEYEWAA